MKGNILWCTVLVALICRGCVDALDLKPENSVTFENAFETERDVEVSLLTTEQYLRSNLLAFLSINYVVFNGEYSDYFSPTDGALLLEHQPGSYTAPWENNYKVLASANVPIPYMDNVKMPEERRDFYKGLICFYKAFIYLDLVRRWGDCVLIRDQVEFAAQGQTSWPKVADYAIEMAREAVRLLPEWNKLTDYAGNPVTHRARPCKGAANAVLANLCAWKAGCKYMAQPNEQGYDTEALWKEAEEACSAIINQRDCYALAANPEAVCAAALVGGTPESIFETVYKGAWEEVDREGSIADLPFLPGIGYQGWPIIPMEFESGIRNKVRRISNSTVRRMFSEGDLRRDAWFYHFEEMEAMDPWITGGYAYPQKYRMVRVTTEGSMAGMFRNFDQNKIWFRLAEIILLRAECRSRLGGAYLAGAIEDLNTIRKRSWAAGTPASEYEYKASEYNGDLRYAIFKECEKEFLMEGVRWYHVLRNEYYATELYGGFLTVSEQDIMDGVFFANLSGGYFKTNPLLRQNVYWLRRM